MEVIMLEPITVERSIDQLRNKISSKITVSTFLAGFNFAALTFILSILSNEKENFLSESAIAIGSLSITNGSIIEFICVMFLISAAFFVASVYSYDRLLMPKRFWRKNASSTSNKIGEKIKEIVLKKIYQKFAVVTFINSCEKEFLSDLNNEQISNNVLRVIEENLGITLSPEARGYHEFEAPDHTAKSWVIKDGELHIRIEKETNDKQKHISKNISTDIQTDLNKATLSEALLKFIEQNRIPISSCTTVIVKEKDRRWVITDTNGIYIYLLEKRNNDLHLYPYNVFIRSKPKKLDLIRDDDALSVYLQMLFAWFTMFIPATISCTIGILLMLFLLAEKISVFVFVGVCVFIFIYYQFLKPRLGTD
jgi:hypothetical protein